VVDVQVLVVGANGQLGFRCCQELVRRGHDVRGSVRRVERAAGLEATGTTVVVADPASTTGLGEALEGVGAVVLTANTAAPRAGDDLAATQRAFERIVRDAGAAGVGRFCLASVPSGPQGHTSPIERDKDRIASQVRAAGMECVALRFPPFMEVWLALVGSSLPARGEPHATVARPSPFLQRFRKVTRTLVEDRGVMLVPGSPRIRNAFIAISDVAKACAEAVERPDISDDVEVGGPEVLSWADVAAIYSDVLGRRVRVLSTPAPVYGAMAAALKPFAPVPSATMALNRMAATLETHWSPGGGGLVDPGDMTTAREFLTAKAALPAIRT
jgi:uncharacterized protein YbjT (DUF2867 family)